MLGPKASAPTDAAEGRLEAIRGALFAPSGGDGVQARTALFERIVEALEAFITQRREPGTEILRFPPVMKRRHVEKAGYLHGFPHLLGCVCGLQGNEAELHAAIAKLNAGGDWTGALTATDLVLTPAACYPLYPLAAERGAVPASTLKFDVASYCFRRESTHEIDRLQAFRMREFVCMGSPPQALEFRTRWLDRSEGIADDLGLSCRIAPASDPFFGRAAPLIAQSQIAQSLKFELLIPVRSVEQPTACMSFNCHRDHFSTTWDLRSEDGELAHTACVAFGIDRLALALFATHGPDFARWPRRVRQNLAL
jgi:seryl-tRNA synthetase